MVCVLVGGEVGGWQAPGTHRLDLLPVELPVVQQDGVEGVTRTGCLDGGGGHKQEVLRGGRRNEGGEGERKGRREGERDGGREQECIIHVF